MAQPWTPLIAKPGLVPAGIDWACPYAAGLHYLFALNEYTPTDIRDLVTRQPVTTVGTPTTPAMVTSRIGNALSTAQTASNAFYYVAPGGANYSGFPYTVMGVYRLNTTPSAQLTIIGIFNNTTRINTVGTPAGVSFLRPQYVVSYGTQVAVNGLATDTDFPHVVFGLSRGSAAHELWQDGGLVSSSTTSAGTTPPTRNRAAAGGNTPTDVFLTAGWSRDLSGAEIAALTANPWQLVNWGLPALLGTFPSYDPAWSLKSGAAAVKNRPPFQYWAA